MFLSYIAIGCAYAIIIHMFDNELRTTIRESYDGSWPDTLALITAITIIILTWPVSLLTRYLMSKVFWSEIRSMFKKDKDNG